MRAQEELQEQRRKTEVGVHRRRQGWLSRLFGRSASNKSSGGSSLPFTVATPPVSLPDVSDPGGGSPPSTIATQVRRFDVFISHATKDDSKRVYEVVQTFLSAKDKTIFNPTTHLSHVEKINKKAMQDAVRRSRLVVAALSEGFFGSNWCAAEIVAAKEAGIKVIPTYSGEDHGANQIDTWVQQYRSHPVFGYVFHENARDVLNKQNPESVNKTLGYLSTLC